MFGNRRSRKNQAERLAGQAWENLTAAVESAGSSTRSARRKAAGLFDDASDRVGSGTKEARRRANAALDALSGKKPRTSWGLLAMFAVIGAAFGWVATTIGRQLAPKVTQKRAEPGNDYPADNSFPEDVSSDLLSRP